MGQRIKYMDRKDGNYKDTAIRNVSHGAKKTTKNDPTNLAYHFLKYQEGKK